MSTQLAEELTYYEKEKDTIATSSTSTKDDVKNGKEIPSIMTKSISVSFNNFNWEVSKYHAKFHFILILI